MACASSRLPCAFRCTPLIVSGCDDLSDRAQASGQLIGGEAEIATYQQMLGNTALEERFQPAVMLHAVGEGVADDAYVIAGLDLQALRRFGAVLGRERRLANQKESQNREDRDGQPERDAATARGWLREGGHLDLP